MDSPLGVFGAVVVALSLLVACAVEHSSTWGFLKRFALSVVFFVGLAAMGAWLGIAFREGLKALP
jgi:hypothetical protein